MVIGKHCGLGSCQMSMVETIRGTKAIIYHHLALFVAQFPSVTKWASLIYQNTHTAPIH